MQRRLQHLLVAAPSFPLHSSAGCEQAMRVCIMLQVPLILQAVVLRLPRACSCTVLRLSPAVGATRVQGRCRAAPAVPSPCCQLHPVQSWLHTCAVNQVNQEEKQGNARGSWQPVCGRSSLGLQEAVCIALVPWLCAGEGLGVLLLRALCVGAACEGSGHASAAHMHAQPGASPCTRDRCCRVVCCMAALVVMAGHGVCTVMPPSGCTV